MGQRENQHSLTVLHVMEATIGGTRRHLRDVAAGQLAQGFEVHLAVACTREPAFRQDLGELLARGARVHEVPMLRAISPRSDWRQRRVLCRLLERERPEIVHTHSSKAGVLGRSASLATGIGARVHTPHTFAFLFGAMFSRPKRLLFRAIEQHFAARTQRLVAVSQGEAETMVHSGVVARERVRVVPNGIDPVPFRAAQALERSSLGVPEGVPLCAVVGLLNRAKGQDLALEALLAPGNEHLHLLLAGHGEDEPQLRQRAAHLGIEARVRFLGWREDVPRILATIDFLLLPSRWEGMPYIVLEAMAAGRPVVATAVDGASELVEPGRTGWLAPVGDGEALGRATAAAAGLGTLERERLGALARERVQSSYTRESMVARLAEVYREALDA